MYVITRRDLSAGQQVAQATHAAFDFAVGFPDLTASWREESSYLIVLAAKDQAELLDLASRAWDSGVRYSAFVEPDFAPGDQVTAVVLEPGEAAARLCANLPLALREAAMV